MKKAFIATCIFTTSIAISQTFSDNFDSYTAGQYLCPQSGGTWTTAGNASGTPEDVLVSDVQAQSGSNSIHFTSSTGPNDLTNIVKHFGTLNTGSFSLQFNVYVESGKDAFFGLSNSGISPMSCVFNDDGTLDVINSGSSISVAYSQNQWINFRVDVNFNANHWEVFLNNQSIGSFSFSHFGNEVESINFIPIDLNAPNGSGFFIDDFQYTITPYTLPALNATVSYMTIEGANIPSSTVSPKITVRNLGTTMISSFDLDVVYNANTVSQSVTGLSLASLADTTITLTGTHTLIAGNNTMVATVSNVNGTTDNYPSDDNRTTTIETVVPALGKMVVGEEATGTWCSWCPAGTVYMDRMKALYPQYWIGIAVHNDDPMKVTEYDDEMMELVISYPSVLVDRGSPVEPEGIEAAFLNRLDVAPKAVITNGATWNATTRELNVSVSAQFLSPATNNYKLAIVLTEDAVTGTTSGYAQGNSYSGGAAGPMGGYESLPNPVPAASMVYNDVARVISPSFDGYANSFPAIVNTGETHTINIPFVLPATWDEASIHIIGLLIAPDGTIDNAGKATIAGAVANGFVSGTPATASIDENNQIDAIVSIYPNPANDYTTIAINLQKESTVSMRILELSGKEVASRNYGSMNGTATVNVNTTDLRSGVYIVEMILDDTIIQRRLVIE